MRKVREGLSGLVRLSGLTAPSLKLTSVLAQRDVRARAGDLHLHACSREPARCRARQLLELIFPPLLLLITVSTIHYPAIFKANSYMIDP